MNRAANAEEAVEDPTGAWALEPVRPGQPSVGEEGGDRQAVDRRLAAHSFNHRRAGSDSASFTSKSTLLSNHGANGWLSFLERITPRWSIRTKVG